MSKNHRLFLAVCFPLGLFAACASAGAGDVDDGRADQLNDGFVVVTLADHDQDVRLVPGDSLLVRLPADMDDRWELTMTTPAFAEPTWSGDWHANDEGAVGRKEGYIEFGWDTASDASGDHHLEFEYYNSAGVSETYFGVWVVFDAAAASPNVLESV